MRFLMNLFDLPWWGGIALLIGLAAIAIWIKFIFPRRFDKMVRDAVLEMGSALKDARVTVHAVSAAAPPAGPSPYDVDEDDENFMEGVDGEPWDHEGYGYYVVDVTIEPASDEALWDPTGLAVVPAEYTPDDEVEISEDLGGLHSAEEFVNGRFQPAREGEIRGSRRLRMLFAIREGVRAVKFANVVTYFGHVDLPAPICNQKARAQRAAIRRSRTPF
jgi:hypothetical protein